MGKSELGKVRVLKRDDPYCREALKPDIVNFWREFMLNSSSEKATIVTTTHIRLDEHGVAWIDNTRVKVIEVVLDKLTHGSSPEEIHFQYPHLYFSPNPCGSFLLL